MKDKAYPLLSFHKNTFRFWKNTILCLLTFFSTFGILFVNNMFYQQTELQYADFVNFPRDFLIYNTYSKNDLTSQYNTNYRGLPYTNFYLTTSVKVINVDLSDTNTTFNLYGVDTNFLQFPLPSSINSNILNFSNLIYGENFYETDIILGNYGFMAYESQLAKFRFEESTYLMLFGEPFYLRGVLADNPISRKSSSQSDCVIDLFIPYTTFEYFVAGNITYHLVVNKSGYTINSTSYNYFDYNCLQKSKIEYKKSISNSFLSSLLIFLLVSCLTIIIISIINIKARSIEIGIRRTIGASKDDICFLFFSQGAYLLFIAILGAFLLSLFVSWFISLYYMQFNYIFLYLYDFEGALFYIAILYLATSISFLIPSLIAANTNISKILQEEH